MMTSTATPNRSVTDIRLARRRFELMAAEHTQRIGARIRERREALDMTQAELAAKVGGKADAQQVSKWERGVNEPKPDRMERIAAALGVSVVYFMAPEPEGGAPNLIAALAKRPNEAQDELRALQADVAALRADVAEITGLLRAVVDPLTTMTEAAEETARQRGERRRKPA